MSSTTAVQFLEQLLASDGLKSQYATYIDTNIRQSDSSFYTRTLAASGKDAAEAALTEFNRVSRRSDYAGSFESVAKGMLAMAKIDTKGEYSTLIQIGNNKLAYPTCSGISGPSQMVLIYNRQAPGCGCNQPASSGDLSTHGRLGLQAVTLQAGKTHDGKPAAQLGLVLPIRSRSVKNMNEKGHTVAAITLDGHTGAHSYSPFLRDTYLQYSLGLIEKADVLDCLCTMGGQFDDAIGFPGAIDYLANVLSKLGEYFSALAGTLSAEHKH